MTSTPASKATDVIDFRDNLSSLEDEKMWDVWYTGSTPFPSEVRLLTFTNLVRG